MLHSVTRCTKKDKLETKQDASFVELPTFSLANTVDIRLTSRHCIPTSFTFL